MTSRQLYNRDRNFSLVQGLKHTNESLDSNNLIRMGRCTWGQCILEPSFIEIFDYTDLFVNSTIYLSCNGYLFSDCNLSYNEMDKKELSNFCIGRLFPEITKEDFLDMIIQYNKRTQKYHNKFVVI